MATLVPKNPVIVKSGSQPVKIYLPAAASKTWKAGEFAKVASGLVSPVVSDEVDIKYYLLKDQDTATSSGDLVACVLVTADMIFEGFELNGTVTTANIGINYALDVSSNIVTVDVDDVSNDCVKITEIASTYEPSRHTTADVKAKVRFRFIQSVLDA